MPHVPRPLLGLLVATVLFFALWLVALKPSSSSTSPSSGVGQYQPALNAAKAAVATSNASNAAAGNTGAGSTSSASSASGATTTSPSVTPAATNPAATAKPSAAAKPAATGAAKPTATVTAKSRAGSPAHGAASSRLATPRQRLNVVDRALDRHKVLALLFYNPAAADDQAVKQELRAIPARHGRVVKLAVPLAELTRYPVVTNQVVVQTSPTLVIIDRSAQAFSLVGFSDGFEIAQRVDDALSMR